MRQENFISLPLGMDCRAPGQKTPTRSLVVPQDWKDAPGMTFGRGELVYICRWQANDWRKDRHDDK